MSIPKFQFLLRPLLAFAKDGTEKNIHDAAASIAREFNLSKEELTQLNAGRKQTVFQNRTHWARTYLEKAGAIKKTQRSHFAITERGQKLLAENPIEITVAILKQFPEFVSFQRPKAAQEKKETHIGEKDASEGQN